MFFTNEFLPKRNFYFLIAVVIVSILMIVFKMLKKEKNISYNEKKLPPEMWFYSKLLDIELGVIPIKNFLSTFFEYVNYKYRSNIMLSDRSGLENLLKEKENDNKIREFIFQIYLDISSFGKDDNNKIKEYIKQIKFNFNKDNLSDWLQAFKENQECNNC